MTPLVTNSRVAGAIGLANTSPHGLNEYGELKKLVNFSNWLSSFIYLIPEN